MNINVKITTKENGLMPNRAHLTSAGMDLRAAEELIIQPGEWHLVPTGIFLEIPGGYEGQVRPRSGLAVRSGITVLNSPGTIDSEYRGEIKVILFNASKNPFKIEKYDRIAQLVICPILAVNLVAGELSSTQRGSAGFGSTGIK
jgi:dUTP pyrophosphatase